MQFKPTSIPGVWVVEPERMEDERGFFARTFCLEEFRRHGLDMSVVQCNVSFNRRKGTLRGLHYQAAPYEEAKLVRCTRGALFDVAVDLRRDSPAFRRWAGVELTAENGRLFYIPKGCAHGFQTLVDDTEVSYLMSESYHPEAARCLRWDDPRVAVAWPLKPVCLSERDQSAATGEWGT